MAILKIKNLPDPIYRKLRIRAKREGRSMSQEATRILADALEKSERSSIMELRGLGKAVWQGVDTGEHVDRERRSWG